MIAANGNFCGHRRAFDACGVRFALKDHLFAGAMKTDKAIYLLFYSLYNNPALYINDPAEPVYNLSVGRKCMK